MPVQIQSIPKVLDGKNLIISSPTASGKTEAVVAPVAERLLEDGLIEGLLVLYVSPTKALVRDLYERIKEPLRELEISVRIKTGDEPRINPKKPDNFIVTTPESFDSLLCRHSNIFSTLKTIIIDEIHLLDGTYRGDQLRILLERLRKKGIQTNYYLLSATLSDPIGTAERYCKDFEVVKIPGGREIVYELIDFSDQKIGLKKVLSKLMENDQHKSLFFCNSRKDAESVSKQLTDLAYGTYFEGRIGTHHASLSKKERLEVEQAMKEEKCFICVCTTTLELGIDIGDIDAVVLVKAPLTVSSMLQRIGRGNRRKDRLIAYGLYVNEEEKEVFDGMFESAKKGEIEKIEYSPSLPVVVQQTFSILYEAKKVRLEELKEYLKPLQADRHLDKIFSRLEDLGYIRILNGFAYSDTKLEDEAERGFIHSNIPDQREMKVIDISSNREVGQIIIDPAEGETFLLAGKAWRIERIARTELYVKKAIGHARTAEFSKRISKGRYSRLLPPGLL